MNEFKIYLTMSDDSCFDSMKIDDFLNEPKQSFLSLCRLLDLSYDIQMFPYYIDESYEMQGRKSFGYGMYMYRLCKKPDSVFYMRAMLEAFAGLIRTAGVKIEIENRTGGKFPHPNTLMSPQPN
jgi:hypothetical protein